MSLELEINAATRAYLLERALEVATPVHRLELKSPDGTESLTVVGQLIPVRVDMEIGHSYSLVFRPESSEIDTNFITHASDRLIWATCEEACEFILNEERISEEYSHLFKGSYFRFWLSKDFKENPILFGSKGGGMIYQHGKGMISSPWFRCPEAEPTVFEMSNRQFNEWAANIYEDGESELRFALNWMELENCEKDTAAFACDNGSWNDLKQIARMVLQVALLQEESLPEEEFIWSFTNDSYSHTIWSRKGSGLTNHSDFLSNWRAALVNHFRPQYLDAWGIVDKIPICIRDYIHASEDNRIKAYKPSNHEVVEAQFLLSNWLKANSIPED